MNLNFGTPLSRGEMKSVIGGLAPAEGTCAAENTGGGTQFRNASKADAMAYAQANGTHWCCDSCSSASWYSEGDI